MKNRKLIPRRNQWLAVVVGALLPLCALAAGQKKKPPSKPLDLNTATVEQLEQLPGIGPATAEAIVRFRERSGPFRRVDDLLAIHHISKSRLDKLRPYVTAGNHPEYKLRRCPAPLTRGFYLRG